MKALFLFIALFLSSSAHAGEFSCTPASFTLTENDLGYVLNGTLETPTPGYSYEIEKDSGGNFTLVLTAPEGMVIQVIDQIEINYRFSKNELRDKLVVNIGKSFSWGEKSIECATVKN